MAAQPNDKLKEQMPKDAQVIINMMKSLGVQDYEPAVINQLLENAYRYISNVLQIAKTYATHAKRDCIDVNDMELAIAMQSEKSFASPPPRDLLIQIARETNAIPLPGIQPKCGVALPPEQYCVTSGTVKLKPTQQPKLFPGESTSARKETGLPLVSQMQTLPATKPSKLVYSGGRPHSMPEIYIADSTSSDDEEPVMEKRMKKDN